MKLLAERNLETAEEIYDEYTELVAKIDPVQWPELSKPTWFRIFSYRGQIVSATPLGEILPFSVLI